MKTKNKAQQLREIVRIFERWIGLIDESQMDCCNISLAQCHALVEIGRAGNISLNDLSQILGLDNSTMSRTVNNLVETNQVARIENPNDRRYITIKLTKQGTAHFQAIEKMMNEYFEDILQAIPEEKQNQVLESLQLLTEVFKNKKCCTKEIKNEK
jgi:DNA-binding MarR family transcriptional regulator